MTSEVKSWRFTMCSVSFSICNPLRKQPWMIIQIPLAIVSNVIARFVAAIFQRKKQLFLLIKYFMRPRAACTFFLLFHHHHPCSLRAAERDGYGEPRAIIRHCWQSAVGRPFNQHFSHFISARAKSDPTVCWISVMKGARCASYARSSSGSAFFYRKSFTNLFRDMLNLWVRAHPRTE